MQSATGCNELSVGLEVLDRGGPPMWEDLMDELRRSHLGQDAGSPRRRSVLEELQAAYDELVAK